MTPVIGTAMTAPVYPPRSYRGKPMTVTGTVRSVNADALVLRTAGGFYTVRADQAKGAAS